jgi:alpha-glucosidase
VTAVDRRPSSGYAWWQRGVIYQVYPRSFQDTDGDGVGDLRGVTARLDYLEGLGIDAIWLSPVFRSPMADFGYDVSDHTDVDPSFGTLADLDDLVARAHGAGIRVILDLVPNHTSSQHPWFLASRSSRTDPRRDWYLWADPGADGGPPNNWRSVFGGSGWEWDEPTAQYYFHSFLREQPDLNWRHPNVQEAVHDVMRFWLDRGIDGFRVDVIWLLVKDEQLRDNPVVDDADPSGPDALALEPVFTSDRPEVHDVIAGMRRVVDAYPERVLIGEIYLRLERLMTYYGTHPHRLETHLPFNFQLLELPWRSDVIGEAIMAYEAALPAHGWPNWVLGNHDRPRIASRVGPSQARVAAMLLLTLRGTPTLYYGDEIGMTDVPIPAGMERDPARFGGPRGGRDPQRTPMRWDASHGAGFTSGTPWLPIGSIGDVNVADQSADGGSMLALHRALIALRRSDPTLTEGSWIPVSTSGGTLVYERSLAGRRLIIALEMTGAQSTVRVPGLRDGRVLLSTRLDRSGDHTGETVGLRPDEGLILQVGMDVRTPT